MSQRKPWTRQEDDLLKKLVVDNEKKIDDKSKWGDIADKLNEKGSQRTGKQCRERWHNQLKPGIDNDKEWSIEEEEILFRVQEQVGNRWALISKELPGRTDNNIKNYFYSTLRKALRKVNSYVQMHKKDPHYRNIKEFKQQNLSKILAVAQKKYESKINLKSERVENDAQKIKRLLVQIQRDESIIPSAEHDRTLSETVEHILEFNRNCKRRKGKKKDSQNQEQMQQEEQSIQEHKKDIKAGKKNNQDKRKEKIKNEHADEQEQVAIQNDLQKKKSSFVDSMNYQKDIFFPRNTKKQSSSSGLNQNSINYRSWFRIDASQNYDHQHDRANFINTLPVFERQETVRNVVLQGFPRDNQQLFQASNMNMNMLEQSGLFNQDHSQMKSSFNFQKSTLFNFTKRASSRLQKINSEKNRD